MPGWALWLIVFVAVNTLTWVYSRGIHYPALSAVAASACTLASFIAIDWIRLGYFDPFWPIGLIFGFPIVLMLAMPMDLGIYYHKHRRRRRLGER